mmetsp:Transcript_32263/g.54382  ORF Transcript_32263/g.54382 Transcript_32263/m.54382 type:complete len:287 (-) Transcript_32263:41-901(-)
MPPISGLRPKPRLIRHVLIERPEARGFVGSCTSPYRKQQVFTCFLPSKSQIEKRPRIQRRLGFFGIFQSRQHHRLLWPFEKKLYHLGARGAAKSMRILRPQQSAPFNLAALSRDASGSENSTKPQPLNSWVSLSVSQRIELMSPQSPKNAFILSSSMSYDRFPQNKVVQPSGFGCISLGGPPPPPAEGFFPCEKSHLIGRPSTSDSFMATAAAAASGVSKEMNPHPLNLPVSRSSSHLQLVIFPQSFMASWSDASSIDQDKLPMNTSHVPVGFAPPPPPPPPLSSS